MRERVVSEVVAYLTIYRRPGKASLVLKTESTWQQGADAARAGTPRSANPYQTSDFSSGNRHRILDMNAWDKGWVFARIQYRKEKGVELWIKRTA
jgi:hypothetical protein